MIRQISKDYNVAPFVFVVFVVSIYRMTFCEREYSSWFFGDAAMLDEKHQYTVQLLISVCRSRKAFRQEKSFRDSNEFSFRRER